MADTKEAFLARVEALARKEGFPYPFDHGAFRIVGATFRRAHRTYSEWEATPDNKASQLWLRSQAQGANRIAITSGRLENAKAFFGLYWNDGPGTGRHPFLDALRAHETIDIHYS